MKNIIPGLKISFGFSFVFAYILLFVSCERLVTEPSVPEFKYKNDKKAEAVIKSGNEFGMDLFRLIAQDDECPENMMISPVSVAMALGMTYNGAEGTTRSAFEETLRLEGFSREEINDIHQSLIGYLLKADPKVVFELANSIWYLRGYNVLQSFIDVNRKYYYAEVSDLDFGSPNAVKTINDWIALKTHDKIQEMLDEIPPDAVMYLINALYFNGTWKYEFDKKNSFSGSFYGDNGVFDVEYMKNESSYRFCQNDIMSMVELPYGNGNFAMKILLPKSGKRINDLLNILDADNWSSWVEQLGALDVVVQIPKFKYDYKSLLNEPLIKMGLSEAFDSYHADFSGIHPDADLYISRVIHQTFIDVNEKGTEAAAATIVEMIRESLPSDKIYFIADKPFIYAITEKSSGALLFMGKVGEPSYD